jgi:PAS domain S-box-containing protein
MVSMSSDHYHRALFYTWTETSARMFDSVMASNRAAFAAFGVDPSDDDGTLESIVGIAADVTDRKEYERELAKSEARYRTIAETANDAILTIDADGAIRFANTAVESIFGYAPDELIGEPLTTLMPERFRDAHRTGLARFLETGERQFDWTDVELPGVRKNGREVELSVSFSTFELDGEQRFTGIIRDVTDRTERERELAYRGALLEAQAETTIDGLLVVDDDRNVRFYNDRFREIWGIPREVAAEQSDEALLESVHELLEDPVEYRETVEDLYERADETSRDTIHLTDGRWLDRYSAPVVGTDGTHYGRLWTFRDITQRKAREEELERQRDELAQLERLNTLVRQISQALQETATQDEIENAVCEHLTESELYRAVWIGARREGPDGGPTVHPRTAAGVEESYLDGIPKEKGPARRAVRTGETQVLNDIASADGFPDGRRDAALAQGHHALAAVPLTTGETTYGVLVVYLPEGLRISPTEEEVLADLGRNIGLAIQRVHSQRSLMADTIVRLELRIPNTEFMFGKITTELDCELTLERRISEGEALIYYITVQRADPGRVCSLMQPDPLVADTTVVREGDESQPALIETRFEDTPRFPLDVLVDYGANVTTAYAREGDIYLHAEIPPEVEIRPVLDDLRNVAPTIELVRKEHVDKPIKSVPGVQRDIGERLTPKQEAALKAAYERGYYAWPRDSTVEELAETFDISAPTFHYRLRIAHQTVLSALLDGDDSRTGIQ